MTITDPCRLTKLAVFFNVIAAFEHYVQYGSASYQRIMESVALQESQEKDARSIHYSLISQSFEEPQSPGKKIACALLKDSGGGDNWFQGRVSNGNPSAGGPVATYIDVDFGGLVGAFGANFFSTTTAARLQLSNGSTIRF